jgi:hypothetical protein
MGENLELDFSQRPPDVSADEVDAVIAYLTGKGWVKARQIDAEIDVDDRRMRVIAERSDGRILSGQKGYRYFDRDTPLEEADRAASWLISQGRKMIQRGIRIRRRYHSYARTP